jgi:hypothetical protein
MALLTEPPEIVEATCLYLTLWGSLHLQVQKNGGSDLARRIMYIHNVVQTLLSIFLFGATLLSIVPQGYIPATFLGPISTLQAESSFYPRYFYHLSKFYEYNDTFLFIAQGNEMGLHFAIHHLTTPWYTTYRVLRDYEGWWIFALLNSGHHVFSKSRRTGILSTMSFLLTVTVVVYGYFAGATWTKPILVWTRNIQLIAGILTDVFLIRKKTLTGEDVFGHWVGAVLLTTYLFLHRREVRMMERAKEDSTKKD